jgi:hypothetical protein
MISINLTRECISKSPYYLHNQTNDIIINKEFFMEM